MFKKLVIPISIFILAGCGESKQVTEEMLIGNWHCTTTVSKARYYDDGKIVHSDDYVHETDYNLSFNMDNNKLIETINNSRPYTVDFKTKKVLDFRMFGKGEESYLDMEYIYVSDNKFKIITNVIERYKSSKQKIFEQYTEDECSRITH